MEGAEKFKRVDWKTSKVAVKILVTLKMRVLIKVRNLQLLREGRREKEGEKKGRNNYLVIQDCHKK